jgi:UDP-N-acetylglucosamine 3-dehydrogenase
MTLAQSLPRIAIIGLGHMGQHHVNACLDSNQVMLTAVVDKNREVVKKLALEKLVKGFTNFQDVLPIADLAIVAVPTYAHASIVMPLLKSGIPCLLEKPIASTEMEAEEIVNEASKSRTTLCIGHVERFNPQIIRLKNELKETSVINSFSTKRLNKVTPRGNDLDEILDLMIHDIDLMRFLKLGKVSEINSVSHTNTTTRIKLESGTNVEFQVSRNATEQIRCISIEVNNQLFHINLNIKKDNLKNSDPLRLQLAAFVDASQGKKSNIASGEDGLEALYIANNIRRIAGLSR